MDYLKSLVKETIPVLIGVLLALLVGEWQQNRKDKSYVEKMFVSIRKEAEFNLDDLEDVIVSHSVVLDSLNFYLTDESISLSNVLERSKGLKKATVKNNTWNAVISQRIELVPYEVISVLNEIETSNELLETKYDKMLTFIFSNLNSKESESKDVLKQHLLNVIDSESTLVKHHRAFLEYK